MRSKSQQLMNEISAYVDQYYSERHMALSVNEIAKVLGLPGQLRKRHSDDRKLHLLTFCRTIELFASHAVGKVTH